MNNTYTDIITSEDLLALKGNPLNEELTLEQKQERVFNLCVELADAQNERKSVMKAHTENIKRIKAEIKDLVSDKQETHDVK